jgi:predicted phosphodiesterase
MRTASSLLGCLILIGAVGCGQPRTPQDLSGLAGWRGAAPNGPETFRFIIISDRTGGHEQGAWERAIVEVNRLKPDFVVCVGDLVEGYKDDEAVLRGMWDEIETLNSRLDAPFFYCCGNHDVEGESSRKVYTQRHGVRGRTYYSFNYRSCHFVVLDSEAIVNGNAVVAAAQWAWLEKDLAGARHAAHVFVLFHHPLYNEPDWAKLRALLDPARTTIFNGHYHSLSYDVEDGIPYYILAATGAKFNQINRENGAFQAFAYVVVDHGRPTISIIPLGQILPGNFVDRHASDVLASMALKAQVGPILPNGTEAVLQLAGPKEGRATATLTWKADDGWFDGGVPAPETITLAPDATVTRTYQVSTSKPQTQTPVLSIGYTLDLAGRTAQRTSKLTLPVIAMLEAGRVGPIQIDGDLADWSGVPATITNTRARVTYGPENWTGPDDSSLVTRLGYDDKKLYIAFDVSDEAIVTTGRAEWERDGIEIFWDPRPDGRRTPQFQGACRHIMIPVPKTADKPKLAILPANSISPTALDVACAGRPGGYVIELAVPFDAIATGWRPSAGTVLYFEAIVNDKDKTEGNDLSNLVLSGEDNASRHTSGYARLTFQP